MYSMWNAPSDRDYYDPYGLYDRDERDEEPEPDPLENCAPRCVNCGSTQIHDTGAGLIACAECDALERDIAFFPHLDALEELQQAIAEAPIGEPPADLFPMYAMPNTPAPVLPAPAAGRLTARELEIAGAVAAGKTNRQIATESGTAETTIKKQVSAILEKLRLANRTQIAIWAKQQQEPAA
jgi:DNA-binding CsgD family transcriptional regulator